MCCLQRISCADGQYSETVCDGAFSLAVQLEGWPLINQGEVSIGGVQEDQILQRVAVLHEGVGGVRSAQRLRLSKGHVQVFIFVHRFEIYSRVGGWINGGAAHTSRRHVHAR